MHRDFCELDVYKRSGSPCVASLPAGCLVTCLLLALSLGPLGAFAKGGAGICSATTSHWPLAGLFSADGLKLMAVASLAGHACKALGGGGGRGGRRAGEELGHNEHPPSTRPVNVAEPGSLRVCALGGKERRPCLAAQECGEGGALPLFVVFFFSQCLFPTRDRD